jgi:uncharacterized protein (DUF1800 family)
MELFCLGPTGPDGTENYLQTDVATLTRCFTGWSLQNNDELETYGTITLNQNNFDINAKQFSAKFANKLIPAMTKDKAAECVWQAIDMVLAHPNHAPFLIRKLWAEFIASPIPQGTLDALVAAYRDGGYRLKPLIRAILMDPLIFESPGEPNLIKPPMVYMVGVLRQLGAPLKGSFMQGAMSNMQQRVYRPPNVSGWEGGMSWLNTNTVAGRWDLITRVQYLKYSTYYAATNVPPADITTETAQQAFDRAYASVNKPWLAQGTRDSLLAYATAAGATTAALRRQRIYTLQSLMLGGPDGQVM